MALPDPSPIREIDVLCLSCDGDTIAMTAAEQPSVEDPVRGNLLRILTGAIYLSERMSNRMLHRFAAGSPVGAQSPIAELSDRELEVFRLIGEGRGARQIAQELHISVKTVESYQAHIKEKLSLKNARELVQQAIQWTVAHKTV
jgi:DNA-binding NarL/FixJ family response regulator